MAHVFRDLALDFSINRIEKLMEEMKKKKKESYTTKNTKTEFSVGWVSVGSNW